MTNVYGHENADLTWALHFTYVQNNHTIFLKYGQILHINF